MGERGSGRGRKRALTGYGWKGQEKETRRRHRKEGEYWYGRKRFRRGSKRALAEYGWKRKEMERR